MKKLSKEAKDKVERENYIRQGFALAKEALELNDQNFEIHKTYAILLDANAELNGLKSRVTEVVNVRKHITRATELNDQDAMSWYILGALEYNLADLAWATQQIVKAIFTTPLSGSFERARECFEKAESIQAQFLLLNNHMLGKTYLQMKEKEKAKQQFSFVIEGTAQ